MYDVIDDQIDSFYVQASAINAYTYCPLSCFYEYVEYEFIENADIIIGNNVHRNVDEFGKENRKGRDIFKAVDIVSDKLGLSARVDLVEFNDNRYIPVEYKKGLDGTWDNNELQLCCQGMILEEKLSINIEYGYIYYAESKCRHKVEFTIDKREKVVDTKNEISKMYKSLEIPTGVYDERCDGCTIKEICMPFETQKLRMEEVRR